MDHQKIVQYRLDAANLDWPAVNHLLEKRDYVHALFFAHLALEKTLKAAAALRIKNHPPYTHNLILLAEQAELKLSDETTKFLVNITRFNIESRYPDEKFTIHRALSAKEARKMVKQAKEITTWIKKQMKSWD